MRTLLLLRHAKSSWKHRELSDHDRPLNGRGKRDAPRMATLLAELRLRPDLILSSTAKRARRTAEAVAQRCAHEGLAQLDRRLYLADPADIVDVLREVGGRSPCVLLIGHNPGLEALVAQLTGYVEPLPTAGLAHIELPIRGWRSLRLTTRGRLVNLWRPRELAGRS